jgi:hypothetical protein
MTGSGFIGTVIVNGNPTQPDPCAVGIIVYTAFNTVDPLVLFNNVSLIKFPLTPAVLTTMPGSYATVQVKVLNTPLPAGVVAGLFTTS